MGAALSIARVVAIAAVGAAAAAEEPIAPRATAAAVDKAAQAVMSYLRVVFVESSVYTASVKDEPVGDMASSAVDHLRRVASSAYESLKAAAASVKDSVIKLVRHLWGDKEADAARAELDRARHDDVLATASARVAAGFGQLEGVKGRLRPSSSSVVSAGRLVSEMVDIVRIVPAARRASQMMDLVKTVVSALGDTIPEEARCCIWVVVAAAGIGIEAIAAYYVPEDA